jgi:serine/threonine protein kinase
MAEDRAPGSPVAGDTLGPYTLEEELGEGSVGIVFRATRPPGEAVALKVLKRALSEDEVYRTRFLREARVAAEVQHRNLVPILDVGIADDHYYLASAYVRARSLRKRIETEGVLSVAEAVRLAGDVAGALDALHGRSLVHRDVTPANIVLTDVGDALLTDFGLAKGRAYTVLTRPGQVVGTPDYFAPELVKGETAMPASDIYSLGCVVYECLTGSPPFGGRSLYELGVAHLKEEPPDPSEMRADLPHWFGWTVLRALQKEPVRRPRTASAYARMLRVAARGR